MSRAIDQVVEGFMPVYREMMRAQIAGQVMPALIGLWSKARLDVLGEERVIAISAVSMADAVIKALGEDR